MRKRMSLMLAVILILQMILPMLTIICESVLTLKSVAYDGTKYYINTAQDMWEFATKVNSGDTFEGVTVYLNHDIDLGCNESKQWVPIGIGEGDIINVPHYFFSGTFEGNNHYIKGIYIDSDKETIGLFGVVNRNNKQLNYKR